MKYTAQEDAESERIPERIYGRTTWGSRGGRGNSLFQL